MKLIIDTNILIDYSKGYTKLLSSLLENQFKNQVELYVNPVIVAEFFTDRTLRSMHKLATAHEFINLFKVVDLTKQTGLLAGEFLRQKYVLYLADALISASCILVKAQLVTRNTSDFAKVPGLVFYKV